MKNLRKRLVLFRNYLVFKKFDLLAKISKKSMPVDENASFVVSIASYPKRDHLLPAVFEALSGQRALPKKWILVLSVEDYTNGLPRHLKKLEDRGIEILWVQNNPYAVKKLIPVVEKYPELGVVTLDDDTIYGKTLLSLILDYSIQNPNTITGFIGKALVKKNGAIGMWLRENKPSNISTNSDQVFLIGVGGIMYPPHSLDIRFLDMEAVHEIVPGRGSDIWFWAAAVAKGTRQVCLGTPHDKHLFISIPETKQTKPKDTPGDGVMEQRFQMAVDYFGIREKLLEELPDLTENEY